MSPPLEPHDYIGLSAAAEAPPTPTSSSSSSPNPGGGGEVGPRLMLRLGLPGSESPDRDVDVVAAAGLTLGPLLPHHKVASSKRAFPDASPRRAGGSAAAAGARSEEKAPSAAAPPVAKAQVVEWPPVRNYRKNTLAVSVSKSKGREEGAGAAAHGGPQYVKVSMDGARYLRKVDLKMYSSYDDPPWRSRRCSAASSLVKTLRVNHQARTGLPMVQRQIPSKIKSMSLHTKIRMLTGCLSVIFHGIPRATATPTMPGFYSRRSHPFMSLSLIFCPPITVQ